MNHYFFEGKQITAQLSFFIDSMSFIFYFSLPKPSFTQ